MTSQTGHSAKITNALIRCTREADAVMPGFELVRPDLGLWVLELDYAPAETFVQQIDFLCEQIERHRVVLSSLRDNCSDFTFHISAQVDEFSTFRIPSRLSRLASSCGFEIEVYIDPL